MTGILIIGSVVVLGIIHANTRPATYSDETTRLINQSKYNEAVFDFNNRMYKRTNRKLLDMVAEEKYGVDYDTWVGQNKAMQRVIDPHTFVRMQTTTGRWINKLNTKTP